MTARTEADRARSAVMCETSRLAGFGPHTPRGARRTEIARLKRAGATHRDIAELFGVTEQAIQQAGRTARRLSQEEWQFVQAVREGRLADAEAWLFRKTREKIT